MKRRAFVVSAATLIITAPLASYFWFSKDTISILRKPEKLLKVCNNAELYSMGKYFLAENSDENSKEILTEKILGPINSINKKNLESISDYIQRKIHHDFENLNTVTIQGWIISMTEARQCALLSLTI